MRTRIDHLRELLAYHRRNLQILELQRAQFGAAVPTHIEILAEDNQAEIDRIEKMIATLEAGETAPAGAVAEAPEQEDFDVSEFRLNSLEATLRDMNSEIRRLADSYHGLDKRQTLTDQKLAQIIDEMEAIRIQVRALGAPSAVDIPRPLLAIFAVGLVAMLGFMLFVTVRLI